MQNPIVIEIKDYAARCGLAPATITSRAVGNSRLFRHLENGGDCTTRTVERIRAYIAGNQPDQKGAT